MLSHSEINLHFINNIFTQIVIVCPIQIISIYIKDDYINHYVQALVVYVVICIFNMWHVSLLSMHRLI